MNTRQTNSEPEPGSQNSLPPAGQQGQQDGQENSLAYTHVQINTQQQFREYTSARGDAIPAQLSTPASPAVNPYVAGTAEQYNSQGIPGPAPASPGYNPYAPPAGYPGQNPYAPPAGYPGQNPYAPPAGYLGQNPYAPPAGYPGQNPYAPPAGYPGYYPAWPPVPPQPKRDTYLLVVGIAAFACSCLVILGGLASLGFMALLSLVPASSSLPHDTYFASMLLFLTLALAGLVGGGFCAYHSIRSLFFRKPSGIIRLPRFWVFLAAYLVTLGLGFWLYTRGLDVSSPVLTGLLIYLGSIFPALTVLSLGIRRLSWPRSGEWPTTWRRFTLSLVSGATLSVILAALLELILGLLLFGMKSNNIIQQISSPNAGELPPSLYGALLILVAVIAPLVEEMLKPLAVVVLIGRVKSKAEAFALGLAAGIGFNLVETTGYIGSGYKDWLSVAIERSGAGLLHGFGAAMVALGWYYLTHKTEGAWPRRLRLALGCIGYALFQHALWNAGAVGLPLLPGPVGTFFQSWSWGTGPLALNGIEIVYIVEVIAILIFFLFVARRLRPRHTEGNNERPGTGVALAPA